MSKKFSKRFITLILAFSLFTVCTAVKAEEIMPFTTNIGYLGTSISESGTCLEGTVTGSFTGDGMHAVYYCAFQYLTSYGEYATIGDERSFRSYTAGIPQTFKTYYCNPTPGVKYRFHTNMKVFDSNGILRDSDVIDSVSLIY